MPFDEVVLNDGNAMPTIAFGTGSKWKRQDVTALVGQAIDAGFWHIDTAAYYETEEYVGKAIRESGLSRSEIFITTKYPSPEHRTIPEEIRKSLKNLGLKHVDLYLIHFPESVPDIQIGWREMETIKSEGLAKSIGVSNFVLEQLQKVLSTANVTPAVNQISLNPYNYRQMKSTIDYCKKNGIVVEAFSSLAPITQYPGGPVDEALQDAAERLKITTVQVIFLWLRAKGLSIVTTTSKKEHMEEYLSVGDLPPLTPEEVEAIDEAGAKGPPSTLTLAIRRGYKRAAGSPVKALLAFGFASFMMYQGMRLW
ncbi:hypothetical protein D9758_014808 [Tetrapyrgos nigripes]|uniref:NADP-dependent oxidoreductase domain-containing protein n=1 Tax=Tetrapyrgos nigripes TaxID=182062 RepID=A0A8H5FGI8_9AGAR|nr:hypothetical protein D9758_014808 [Tetrapyrgos nigripes]